jgi:hypothetical protein
MAGFDPDVFSAPSAPQGFDPQVFTAPAVQWVAAAAPKAPTEDPGFWNAMLIGAGKTTNSVLDGLTQAYLAARGETSALGGLKQNVDNNAGPYKALQQVRPFATGLGEALPSMAVPFGAGATALSTAGRMALASGLPGALEYGTLGERASRAGIGAAAGAALPLGIAGFRTAKSLAEPLYQGGREAIAARTLNRLAGDDAAAAAARMVSAQPLVPNSMPTAGQVAENGGIAALERSVMGSNPTPFTTRAMEQASARLSALRGVAQDDAALAAATAARDSATKGLYAQADQAVVPADAQLKELLARMPGGGHNGVIQSAMELAKVKGEPLKIGKDIPASFTAATDATGAPILQDVAAQPAEYSGKALHYIKLALDDAMSKTGDSSMGNTMKSAVQGLKQDYLGYLDNAIPAYGQARTQFAALSKPVNQMEIGQDLLKKVQPALADYGALGRETGATYGTALRNADATAARVTGFQGAKMKDIMTPDQMATLNAVAQDLARKANSQDLGRGIGSNTFQNLAMQNIAEQSGMPRLTRGLLSLPGINRATNWVYRDSDAQVQNLLASTMLDPASAGLLMTKAQQKMLADNPKARQALEQAAMRSAGLLGLSATAQ